MAPRVLVTTSLTVLVIGLFGLMTYGNLTGAPGFREVRVVRDTLQAAVLTTGRTQPNKRIDARSPLSGRADQVLVHMGDKVTAGQVLVWTSSTERAEILDAARANRPAQLAQWKKEMQPTAILAPVSGTVIQRNIEPGQTFTEADPVIVISDEIIVECPVDELEIGKLFVGQRASATLDSYSDVQLPGYVKYIAYDVKDYQNGNPMYTYMVRMAFDHIPDEVRVGMTANVKFETMNKPHALLIPVEALHSDENSYYVLIPGGFGQEPEHRPIKLGDGDGHRMEVTEGLSEGDIVLVDQRAPKKPKASKGAFSVDHPSEI